MSETINAVDFEINYFGKLTKIEPTTRIFALFNGGSGFTDDNGGYYGSTQYFLYKTDKWGKILTKIGEASDNHNGYDYSCNFTINGNKHVIHNVTIDQIFARIFKKES